MADLVLWRAKSAVEEMLSKVNSTIEEEAGLDPRMRRDLVFIVREFEMIRWFLDMTDEELGENSVVRTAVNQVRDLAFDVGDCVQFISRFVNSAPIWWVRMLPICITPPLPIDQAAWEIEHLKDRVESASQLYMRCKRINDSGSRFVLQRADESAAITDILGEVREAARKRRVFDDLRSRLITVEDSDLQVISFCGTEGDRGSTASIIRKAYDVPEICQKFTCRAWVKLVHPFNPYAFVWTLLTQFCASSRQVLEGTNISVDVGAKMETSSAVMKEGNLMKEFMEQVNKQRYLVVLEDLSTIADWDSIRVYLPDLKNGSRIVVSTKLLGIATLCTRDPCQVTELRQSSADDSACAFFKMKPRPEVPNDISYFHQNYIKDSQDGRDEIKEAINEILIEDRITLPPEEILNIKRKEASAWLDKFCLVGRQKEVDKLNLRLLCGQGVTTVWGIPRIGKSALTRSAYYSEMIREVGLGFNMYSWVDVPHPFNLTEFSHRLLLGFLSESVEAKDTEVVGIVGSNDPMQECHELLSQHVCFIVIDGLRSKEDWDLVESAFLSRYTNCLAIVITNEASVATHCAISDEAVINVKSLGNDAALELFAAAEGCKTLELREGQKIILSKCGGLPEVIDHVGRNWDILEANSAANFMGTLENHARFQTLKNVFDGIKSYISTCPDILRPCIFGLSVFPANHGIRRRRLGRRWIAEGYFRDTDGSTAEEDVEKFFSKLVDQNIIEHASSNALTHKGMVICQVNGFFHEYITSRSMDGGIVSSLEGRCSLNSQHTGQHLTIKSSWDRDSYVFECIDFSRLRSLTVSGGWRSFFISHRMRLLRVLDLEDASGVTDVDLDWIIRLLTFLKFLSIRGCKSITRLPSSVGWLRQLQTLDIRHTSVVILPLSITKLQKLQYIRAATTVPWDEGDDTKDWDETPIQRRRRPRTLVSWLSKLHRRRLYNCGGVELPPGIGKLTALQTLGAVNVSAAGGEAFLKELKKLTQLRKLQVSGINPGNSNEFWTAISGHGHLESLSVWLDKDNQRTFGSLDDISQPPKTLKSIKLYGHVHKLPVWIKQLNNLQKLDIEMTISAQEDIHVLAELPCRHILRRLCVKPINQDGELHFCWPEHDRPRPEESFNLVSLKIDARSMLQVTFGEWLTVSVEVLRIRCSRSSSLRISGLQHLWNLRKVSIGGLHDEATKQDLERQLMEHPCKPDLVLEEPPSW